METTVEITNLKKNFVMGKNIVQVLRGINLTIKKGEVCCFLGKSGCGKSTLLNILAGLDKPTSGKVKIAGNYIENMDENKITLFRQKYIGFVFQSFNLIPYLTALENIAMPLAFRGVPLKKRNAYARKLLEAVGLETHWNHLPTQMSGGQQQRIAIARAFVASPKVVFADEPTGNLDTKTSQDIINLMLRLVRENNQTLIMVTHDMEIASYADRVIRLKDGEVESDY